MPRLGWTEVLAESTDSVGNEARAIGPAATRRHPDALRPGPPWVCRRELRPPRCLRPLPDARSTLPSALGRAPRPAAVVGSSARARRLASPPRASPTLHCWFGSPPRSHPFLPFHP